MSLLEKLWDDTLAGPRPENGLGKLRKKPATKPAEEVAVKVTRSIMIVKPPQISTNLDGTPPPSPAASPAGTPPVSPFASGREAYRLMRRKSLSDAYEKANKGGAGIGRPPFNDV